MSNNDPKRWSILNDLFDAVIDLPSADQLVKLREIAESHPDYIKDLQDIVTAHHQAEHFMAQPVAVLNSLDATNATQGRRSKPKVFQPGDKVGEFEILGVIGEGSFAVVYRALQKSLERVVALKISGAADREARDMASLEHDHIVRVFSETTVSEDHLHIICMQYVEGMTLAELIKRLGPLNPAERQGSDLIKIIDNSLTGNTPFNAVAAKDRDLLNSSTFISCALWIGARLAEALDFAHAKGVLHLDMKPANVLLNQYGRPLLTDFNVAMNIGGVNENKKQILKGGTAGYMSPEQERMFASGGKDPSIKIRNTADIYALAIVISELLLCKKIRIGGVVKSIDPEGTAHLKNLPEEVAGVLAKALALDESQRFQSGKDFAEALEHCRQLLDIQASIKTDYSWHNTCENNPMTFLVLATMVPQLLGSIVNISYNSIRIAADLTPAQQEVFLDTILPYNLIVYPMCFTIVARQIFFLIRHLKSRKIGQTPFPDELTKIRQKALSSPKYLFAACTIGWLPGALIFPLIIDFQAGPISSAVYWHFGISFITSWLIALTYSYFLLELLLVSVLYPKFWSGCCNIFHATVELTQVKGRMKLFQIMAGAIPLLGALMIVGSSSAIIDLERYRIFQIMIITLIAMAICGFMFAIKTSERITAVIAIFVRKTGR